MKFDQSLVLLTPIGKIVIVEDLFVGQNENRHTRHLLKEWHLKAAYTLTDYQSVIEHILS